MVATVCILNHWEAERGNYATEWVSDQPRPQNEPYLRKWIFKHYCKNTTFIPIRVTKVRRVLWKRIWLQFSWLLISCENLGKWVNFLGILLNIGKRCSASGARTSVHHCETVFSTQCLFWKHCRFHKKKRFPYESSVLMTTIHIYQKQAMLYKVPKIHSFMII